MTDTLLGRRFTPLRITGFIIVVAGILALQGWQKIPTHMASGNSLNGNQPTTQPSGENLRVATFNIDGQSGTATIQTLQGFDIAGLEEVHGGFPPVFENNAQVLGEALKLNWLFAPVEHQWWRDSFGDGILTNLPINHWERIVLTGDLATSNREMLLVNAIYRGKPLNILVTHLSRDDDRDAEFAAAAALFNALQTPALLIGDFNSPNADPVLTQLRATPGVIDPIGDSVIPKRGESWDRIFARGFTAVDCGFIDKGASDHPLAWAELKLKN